MLVGVALLVVATMLLALGDALAKHLTSTLHPVQVMWARFAFFALPMTLLLGPRRVVSSLTEGQWHLQVIRAVLAVGSAAAMVLALQFVPLGIATAILFTSPLLVTVLGVILLGEPLNGHVVLSAALGFMGVLLISRPGVGVFSWYSLLPLVTALCFALYQIVTRRLSGASRSGSTLLVTGVLGSVLASAVVPMFWITPSAEGWLLLALAGAVHGSAHYLMIRALSLARSTVLAPYLYVQLLTAMVLGVALFGESPDLGHLAGAALIVAGGIYLVIKRNSATE